MHLIIDGNNLAIRGHFKMSHLQTKSGIKTGAIHGFLTSFAILFDKYEIDSILVCWDGGRSQWRKDLYPEYKANRSESPEKAQIYDQFSILRAILATFPEVHQGFRVGIEADDLIAFALKNHLRYQSGKTIILTSDEDFYQLMDESTAILKPGSHEFMTPSILMEEMGCTPREYLLAKSIAGDSSDNIHGIKGIGISTGIKLIKEFGESFSDWMASKIQKEFSKRKKFKAITSETIENIILRNKHLMDLTVGANMLLNQDHAQEGYFYQSPPGVFNREDFRKFVIELELNSVAERMANVEINRGW